MTGSLQKAIRTHRSEHQMRFMMFMYPEIDESDWNPSAEAVEAMSRYNHERRKAGMLLALAGRRRRTEGASGSFKGSGEATVTDGPFAEAKEVVGGYWIIQARSTEEAIEWAKRCPGVDCRVEVRPIWEMEDFSPEIKEALKVYDEDLHPGV